MIGKTVKNGPVLRSKQPGCFCAYFADETAENAIAILPGSHYNRLYRFGLYEGSCVTSNAHF